MNKTFRKLVWPLLALCAACGSKQENSWLAIDGDSKKTNPLIISMTGFASCKASDRHDGNVGPLGSRMMENVFDLQKFIEDKSGSKTEVMASCFTSERQLMTSSSLNDWNLENPTDEEYLGQLRRTMLDFSDVYVIGHSYGGWLSMKLISDYHGPSDLIKSLYTIDPISKKLCFFNNPRDCVEAPKDISPMERQHIKDKTDLWVNPWQQKTLFLHSSSIPQADENPRFDISHWEIDNLDAIWNGMKSRLTL